MNLTNPFLLIEKLIDFNTMNDHLTRIYIKSASLNKLPDITRVQEYN